MQTVSFETRHNGPREHEISKMLSVIGVNSVDDLIDKTIPARIRLKKGLSLSSPMSEYEYLKELRNIASKNKLFRTYIGMGYYNTICPSVIKRNILENPSWYTSYTPYQAEISQGRLEALLNFQTMVTELTGMEIANASLLDEATAAAEAMTMFFNTRSKDDIRNNMNCFVVDKYTFPQTIDVLKTRANALKIELIVEDISKFDFTKRAFGILIQYPNNKGIIANYKTIVEKAHQASVPVAVAADILSLAILVPPGEWGADVVFGSTQRFGIPMGYGGPHAAYFATRESYKRSIPGRIIGVSVDVRGKRALRMALQTREQHIKRERATSNICTAQALLAIMAGMYAAYHGPEGLKIIASNIHELACILSDNLMSLGIKVSQNNFFDTLKIETVPSQIENIKAVALKNGINFGYSETDLLISIDETTNIKDIHDIFNVFATALGKSVDFNPSITASMHIPENYIRKSRFLELDVFTRYQSETEMMRYIKKLERKDISLTHSMISLGSCTMKLNAATEMAPLSWPEFADIHPFVPTDQCEGYNILINQLGDALKEITGFQAISFQPNSGASGEYTGLMVIREYHHQNNQANRDVILIPSSAHGTNPASAVMAGFSVIVVDCDEKGNIKINHLEELAFKYKENLAGFMVTYPSTHGVFESDIIRMTEIIHNNGGLVYMDGANMNAQVGLTNPAAIGADVCHLNLHKTFAIPHGGGGPGMGPIAVNKKLEPFLPNHPVIKTSGDKGINAVAAAPYGSASILCISHAYIKLLGSEGLTNATKIAILNANYIAASLKKYFKVLYTGENGYVAHEMILDCREFKQLADISEADIAKRLMDFGFHAPTLSFPVHGTLMVEPTESESFNELNRFIEALQTIHNEIIEITNNKSDKKDNVLKNAPHTQDAIINDQWDHSYSRQQAAFPLSWVQDNKFWPAVSRIDDAFGDRNLICTCAPVENYKN